MSLRARLADAIAEALESNPSVDLTVPFARGRIGFRVADVLLSLPGIAIVELPPMMEDRSNVAVSIRCQPMWTAGDAWVTVNPDSSIEFEADEQYAYGTLRSPEAARTLAAALLAAANAAEQHKDGGSDE